jgi:adenosylmethionine-8-amino-7-oxononanoate aminotransferase
MTNVLYGNVERHYRVIERGEGIYLYDADGNRILDATGGPVCVGIGHGVKEVVDAMAAQAHRIAFVYGGQFTSRVREELAAEIADFTGGRFSKVFFVSGGSEATEAALKLARLYHLETGSPQKHLVISCWKSYHGNTIGALSMGGRTSWREPYTPYLLDFPHIAPAYCYRCAYGLTYPACRLRCAHELEAVIRQVGPAHVSAFICEPITGGSIPAMAPPPEYLPIIREICDRYGVLYISDEVLCGFGRTGKTFGVDHYGVTPDLIAVGKGLSSGYAPLGAVLVPEQIAEAFRRGSGQVRHSHTFAGIPISCAAGLAVLRYVRANHLIQRSAEMGRLLFQAAARLSRHAIVGEIAGGKGLLLGIELVQDRATREPFPATLGLSAWIARECLAEGMNILSGSGGCADGVNGDRIEISPPFIVQVHEIETIVDTLDRVLGRAQERFGGRGSATGERDGVEGTGRT